MRGKGCKESCYPRSDRVSMVLSLNLSAVNDEVFLLNAYLSRVHRISQSEFRMRPESEVLNCLNLK